MALQRTSVGIDIGKHAVKVVQLRITEKGALIQNALYFDCAELSRRGIDPEDRLAVAALLKNQMAEHRIPTGGVVLGISGNDSILRYTSVPPVPPWRLKIILDYEVKEVAEKIGEKLASDYKTLSLPREQGADQVVLVGLSKEEELGKLLGDLESAGIVVEKAIPAPLALYAAYNTFGPKGDPENPEDELLVLLDMGRTNLNVALILNDQLAYARSVTFGGDTFSEALARDLGVKLEKAEKLKIREGTVDMDETRGRLEVVHSMRGTAAQLQNLIQSSLRFCRNQTGVKIPEPTKIFLVGGGTRLRGLSAYLEQVFRKPVQFFQPSGVMVKGDLPTSAGGVLSKHPSDFSIPLGLAAAGLKESAFALNILPSEFKERRRFRDRTIFIYAAGVLLLATLLAGLADAFFTNRSVNQRASDLKEAAALWERRGVEMAAFKEENTRTRERINRILREVEVSSFQAFLMDFLMRSLRPEIRFSRIQLGAELNDEETDFLYQVVLDGLADNSDQKGLQLIDDFQKELRQQSRVASVNIQGVTPSGRNYKFQVVVTPSFQVY